MINIQIKWIHAHHQFQCTRYDNNFCHWCETCMLRVDYRHWRFVILCGKQTPQITWLDNGTVNRGRILDFDKLYYFCLDFLVIYPDATMKEYDYTFSLDLYFFRGGVNIPVENTRTPWTHPGLWWCLSDSSWVMVVPVWLLLLWRCLSDSSWASQEDSF